MKEVTLNELFEWIAQYDLKPNDLARICGINDSQMRQYALGIETPRPKTIEKINKGIKGFTDELTSFSVKSKF